MLVEVMKPEILYKKSHQSCSEEHANRIFDGKMKLELVCSWMELKFAYFGQDKPHDKFIEKNDWNKSNVDNDSCWVNTISIVLRMWY